VARLLRVVQFDDLAERRAFRTVRRFLEGKFFWTTRADAERFARLLRRSGIGPSWIVETRISGAVFKRLGEQSVDGRPARYVEEIDLDWFNEDLMELLLPPTDEGGPRVADLSFEAEIALLSTDRGRRSAVSSGYRPALWFGETAANGEPELHSAVLRVVGDGKVEPGERGDVLLRPLAFETWPQVRPGMHFDIFDAGQAVGTGTLRAVPTPASARAGLRDALGSALEEWLVERFGDPVGRRARRGKREPDLIGWFDDMGRRHAFIAEIKVGRPGRPDVDRLARMMAEQDASFGIIVALDQPSAAALDVIRDHGTIMLSHEVRVPRIRVLTARDLARGDVDLLPRKQRPQALELLAA
jgi:hypothetical protein